MFSHSSFDILIICFFVDIVKNSKSCIIINIPFHHQICRSLWLKISLDLWYMKYCIMQADGTIYLTHISSYLMNCWHNILNLFVLDFFLWNLGFDCYKELTHALKRLRLLTFYSFIFIQQSKHVPSCQVLLFRPNPKSTSSLSRPIPSLFIHLFSMSSAIKTYRIPPPTPIFRCWSAVNKLDAIPTYDIWQT